MTVLLNRSYPYLSIYSPTDGQWIQFQAGKLVIEADDPHYEVVMAEATRNPSIVIVESGSQCVYCGEVFAGKMAAADLGAHQKEIHFAEWLAAKEQAQAEEITLELKSRSTFYCDVCQPLQEFPTAEALALHTAALHAAPPKIDSSGNATDEVVAVGASDAGEGSESSHRPGEVEPEIPTAHVSRRRSG